MITQKGRFLIKYENIDKDYLESFDFEKLEEKYQEIKKFYSFAKDLPLIRICFVYTPEEYLFFSGYPMYEKWMSACTGYHTTIYIFAPSIIEKFTTHKKESIFGTFVHELSHLFYGYSKLFNLPLFNEGIAQYHRNKTCDNQISFKLPSLKKGKNLMYDCGVGHLMICSIMEHFGESGANKIIKFLKSASLQMNEEKLFNLFKEIFGKSADSLIELKGGKEK